MNRRNLIKLSFFSTAALLAIPQLAAAQTPPQTEGPFYPVVDQTDKDSDLVQVNGSNLTADGEIVIVEGTLTDQHGVTVSNALVEIWQACKSGRYNHPSDPNTAPLDPHFQYWGKAVTDEQGHYRFRTIIPGSYPADVGWDRPPHIHFKISKRGYHELISQMYFMGEALNERDLILKGLSEADQKKVIVEFKTAPDKDYALGRFDIQIDKVKI